MPKPNPANMARKDKIVEGLVTVKKNVEMKLLKRPLVLRLAAVGAGLDRNDFIPKKSKNNPPTSFIQNSWVSKKEEMAVKPKPAIIPYTVSAIAAPIPVTNPEIRPSDNVRFIVSTPIGPTGAATEKPMSKPFSK